MAPWIPTLEGVEAKLTAGATVADVGCGHGTSTIIHAQAYPRSRFSGFDNHGPSIAAARQAAAEAGGADRIVFEVAGATEYPGQGYDLVAYFDCQHDMGDPVGALRHAREALAPDGTVMIVEPMAGEHVEEKRNPLGRVFSGASVLCCTPNALAAGGPTSPVLGAIATETPFNRVFEARP